MKISLNHPHGAMHTLTYSMHMFFFRWLPSFLTHANELDWLERINQSNKLLEILCGGADRHILHLEDLLQWIPRRHRDPQRLAFLFCLFRQCCDFVGEIREIVKTALTQIFKKNYSGCTVINFLIRITPGDWGNDRYCL